jgi:hypothetical protein
MEMNWSGATNKDPTDKTCTPQFVGNKAAVPHSDRNS